MTEPVLFLHGVSGSAATYQWLELEDRRTVRVDFRGHGDAPRRPGTYRLPDYVDDALAVLEELGRAAVVGHSLGGVTAWTLAQQRPDLVTRLFLEDPPLYMGDPVEHERNPGIPAFRDQQAAVRAWQARGATEAEIEAELDCRDLQTPEALAARAHALRRLDPEVLDRVVDGSLLAAADPTSPVEVPVLILAADDAFDAAFPTRHEAQLARTHPDVRVVRFAGAPHTIHDTTAFRDAYAAQLRAWL
ncbi:alpha/beta hydrolase [Solirubrobacter sp. CPCC 204708]|uniref:Alpha/beta hydrolase n=1 Tax=Solirubrobacter deserti TaxID=2282478 RepID=A0ABT4RPT2_9ACTN|nr:alpha/beta hydrolase [Solirubrobacter deserti]MBE2319911.1 alpha/beta hydrolase [Solirubrobacter deserti]MDA0140495.1 alpha/beta hydrolase [Solirubrobacter deserti]